MNIPRSSLPDTMLLVLVGILVVAGIFVFMSASFGLLLREGREWGSVLFSQFVLGLGGGLVLGFVAYKIPLVLLRKFSVHLFILASIMCLLVFVPGVGFSAGGAARWIHLGGVSIQPSEFLKLALGILLAAWAAARGEEIRSVRYGLLPFLAITTIAGGLLIAEPDTGTFVVLFATACSIFLVAGGRIKHLFYLGLGALVLIGGLALARPYVRARIATFLDPSSDPLGSSYQIRQSLLAIGSGQTTGRGFGQSIQKFQYLPEPIGDSIFAVVGEEFGFMGTFTFVLLFLFLCLRGMIVSLRAPTKFHRLLGVGIVILIVIQAYLHIGAMVGILPLTGVPLPLISHGGTALMFALISLALLLQISRYRTH